MFEIEPLILARIADQIGDRLNVVCSRMAIAETEEERDMTPYAVSDVDSIADVKLSTRVGKMTTTQRWVVTIGLASGYTPARENTFAGVDDGIVLKTIQALHKWQPIPDSGRTLTLVDIGQIYTDAGVSEIPLTFEITHETALR